MAGDLIFNDAAITVHVAAVNVYGNPVEVSQRLDQIAGAVDSLLSQGVQTMATLDDLVDKVSEQSGTIDSMTTFVAGLEQQIKDALAGVTLPPAAQAKVDALLNGLTSNTQKIADAIDNDPNTPAAPGGGGGGGGDDGGGTPPEDGVARRG